MKKLIGFLISLLLLIVVLSVLFTSYMLKRQEKTMSYVFTEETIDGMLDGEQQKPRETTEEGGAFGTFITISLMVTSAATLIFGYLFVSDRIKQISKKESVMPMELMIVKELAEAAKIGSLSEDKKIDVPSASDIPPVIVPKPIIPKNTTSQFELGNFLESEMDRLLLLNFKKSDKKAVIFSDMNKIAFVFDRITEDFGTDICVELVTEVCATIEIKGYEKPFDEILMEDIKNAIEGAMGTVVFEDDKTVIKFPVIT